MPLTGSQLDPIASAIQTAYDRDELRKVLSARLSLNFDDYAPEKGYATQLWTFLQALNRQDRIPEIVRCLQTEKPTNTELQAVRAALEPGFTPAAAPAPETAPTPPASTPAGTTIHVAGDYIVGNVGSNSPNVAIGKDITQTVTTSPVTVSAGVSPAKPVAAPPAKGRSQWFSSVWTLVLAPIIVGVVLLLVGQWMQRKDDASATPTPTTAGPVLTVGEGEKKQVAFGNEQVLISVPTYHEFWTTMDYIGQDIRVSIVAPAASRFVTMTVGSCAQAGDYRVNLVDLQVHGPQRGDFVVTKPVTATANTQCQ